MEPKDNFEMRPDKIFALLCFLELTFALVVPSGAEDPKRYWILEAATPLRSQPKAQSEVKTQLRTGTGFYSSKQSADWVNMGVDHEKSALSGWVPSSMVSESEVDRSSLLKGLRQAKSTAESIPWLERILSMQPESTAYLEALQKAYATTGDTAKAAHCGRELRGTNPIYLARHDGGDVLVFGVIDSAGGFRNLLWSEVQGGEDDTKFTVADSSSRAIKKRALALRDKFASMAWYGCGGTAAPGSRVWARIPKVAPDVKKRGSFPKDVEGRATFGISLGSSTDFHSNSWPEEVIFATRPAFRVPVSGIKGSMEWDSLAWYRKDLVGSLFDSTGIAELQYTALPEYGYVDIRIRGPAKTSYSVIEQRGIFDGRKRRVWPPEGQTTYDAALDDTGRIRSPTEWFRFGPNASYPAFIILPFSNHYQAPDFEEGEYGNSGYQLLRLDNKGLKAFTLRSISGGC